MGSYLRIMLSPNSLQCIYHCKEFFGDWDNDNSVWISSVGKNGILSDFHKATEFIIAILKNPGQNVLFTVQFVAELERCARTVSACSTDSSLIFVFDSITAR